MHKDAISADFETMELEQNFEEKFGREMTREERRLFALSANLLDPTDEVEAPVRVERRSNLRIMPTRPNRRVA